MRCLTASVRAGLVGPRFDPLDDAELYANGAVADGRLQKYFGSAERLADQLRPEWFAAALDDAAVGSVVEQQLRRAGDEQRIGDAGEQRSSRPA